MLLYRIQIRGENQMGIPVGPMGIPWQWESLCLSIGNGRFATSTDHRINGNDVQSVHRAN